MRLTDLAEGKKGKDTREVKPRDPNWRDMEALRKSGAAGSHGDKTKTIPRKEKYKKLSMDEQFAQYMSEADPAELGPMNDKMHDVLGKVHADDQEKEKEKQAELERKAQEAENDRQRLAAELGDEGMQDYISKLKSHDWFYAYSDDHRYYTKGSEEWKEISRLQKILDPNHEVYNKYAPDMMKSVKADESVEEAHGNDKMYDKCWDGYKKVPGKKRGEKGSCVKENNPMYKGEPYVSGNYGTGSAGANPPVYKGKKYQSGDARNNPSDYKGKPYESGDAGAFEVLKSYLQKALEELGLSKDPKAEKEVERHVQSLAQRINFGGRYESKSVMDELNKIDENATAGATSAGNIASVANPHVAIGNKKARKDYGIRGKQPNPPKAKPIKPTDNALDMKGTSVFGGTLKRST